MSKIIKAFEKEVKQTDQDILELTERKKGLVIDMSTDAGFKEGRKERTELNKSLKEIDSIAIQGKNDIDAQRKIYKERVSDIYKPIVDQFETEDLRRKELKKQEEIKEAARVKAIRDEINGIRMFSLNLQGKTSLEISEIIEAVDMIDVAENFAEHTQEAMQVKSETLGELNVFLSSAIQNEQLTKARETLANEQKELDEERAEFEAWKASQAKPATTSAYMKEEVKVVAHEAKEEVVVELSVNGPFDDLDSSVALCEDESITILKSELDVKLHYMYVQGWNDGLKSGLPYDECQELAGE